MYTYNLYNYNLVLYISILEIGERREKIRKGYRTVKSKRESAIYYRLWKLACSIIFSNINFTA